ncbi:hypothetical protein LSAT2_000674 [Lamellibrachia satsuma]|nr:hypothetical protein LSAT2_000674 [Lamellibrachia satsuma]
MDRQSDAGSEDHATMSRIVNLFDLPDCGSTSSNLPLYNSWNSLRSIGCHRTQVSDRSVVDYNSRKRKRDPGLQCNILKQEKNMTLSQNPEGTSRTRPSSRFRHYLDKIFTPSQSSRSNVDSNGIHAERLRTPTRSPGLVSSSHTSNTYQHLHWGGTSPVPVHRVPEDSEGCNLLEDSEGCNFPEDSDGCNLPEDSEGCNLMEDSERCNLLEDSEGCNFPEDSEGCNFPEDSEGCNLPEDSEGCNFPEGSEGCDLLEDSEGCNFPQDSEGCDLPKDNEGCNLPEGSEGCDLPKDSEVSIWSMRLSQNPGYPLHSESDVSREARSASSSQFRPYISSGNATGDRPSPGPARPGPLTLGPGPAQARNVRPIIMNSSAADGISGSRTCLWIQPQWTGIAASRYSHGPESSPHTTTTFQHLLRSGTSPSPVSSRSGWFNSLVSCLRRQTEQNPDYPLHSESDVSSSNNNSSDTEKENDRRMPCSGMPSCLGQSFPPQSDCESGVSRSNNNCCKDSRNSDSTGSPILSLPDRPNAHQDISGSGISGGSDTSMPRVSSYRSYSGMPEYVSSVASSDAESFLANSSRHRPVTCLLLILVVLLLAGGICLAVCFLVLHCPHVDKRTSGVSTESTTPPVNTSGVSTESTTPTVSASVVLTKSKTPTGSVNSTSPTPSTTTSVGPNTTPTPSTTTSVSPNTSPTPSTTTSVGPNTTPTPSTTTSVSPNTTPTPSTTTSVGPNTTPTPSTTTSVGPNTTPAPSTTTSVGPNTTPTPSTRTSVGPNATPTPSTTTSVGPNTTPTPSTTTSVGPNATPTPSTTTSVGRNTTPTPSTTTSVGRNTTPTPSTTTSVGRNTTPTPSTTTSVGPNTTPTPSTTTSVGRNTTPTPSTTTSVGRNTTPTPSTTTSVGPNTTPTPSTTTSVGPNTTPTPSTTTSVGPNTTPTPSTTTSVDPSTTDSLIIHETRVIGTFRLTKKIYTSDLANLSSDTSQQLTSEFCAGVNETFRESPDAHYKSCDVQRYSNGSVITDFALRFRTTFDDNTQQLLSDTLANASGLQTFGPTLQGLTFQSEYVT